MVYDIRTYKLNMIIHNTFIQHTIDGLILISVACILCTEVLKLIYNHLDFHVSLF